MAPTYDVLIDARGLSCPLPLLKARQALMMLGPGATVCLLATDPAAPRDIAMFVEASGHRLLRQERTGDLFLFVLEKADPNSPDPLADL
jgi:tRNA 2-thiouridine synthesizing protein A